jgi:hypothetical protein
MKELIAFVLDGHDLQIRPAPIERDWMDASNQRFAYRCLPLNIANAHGWEILCPTPFTAIWNGRKDRNAVSVEVASGSIAPAISHFGEGVLTFHVPCLFRTDPEVDLYVTGPVNRPKDGIAALTGIVETDWSAYTFTMNWLFTRANHRIKFEAGEPFCHLFPVARGQLEGIAPTLRKISSEPALDAELKQWVQSRSDFNASLNQPDSQAAQDRWQKSYFKGVQPSGQAAPDSHRSRLRLNPFTTGKKEADSG